MSPFARRLAAIFLLALALRGGAAAVPGRVISRDGIRYSCIARAAGRGDIRRVLADDYTPGYPLAAGLLGLMLGAERALDFTRAAVLASVLAGALLVFPVASLARSAMGERAGLFAALAAALHPRHVAISADALSEPLACLLALAALAVGFRASEEARTDSRRAGRSAALSGLFAVMGSLVRPEVALALLPPIALPRARLRRVALAGAPVLLVLIPYVAHVSATRGQLLLPKRKDPAAILRHVTGEPLSVVRDAGRNALRSLEAGQATAALAILSLAFLARGARAPRQLAVVILTAYVSFLAVYSCIRSDPRFSLALSLLALPLAGIALAGIAEILRPRLGERASPLAAGLLAAATLPGILHSVRADRPHVLACARRIEAILRVSDHPAPVVWAQDERIPFYAGAFDEVDVEGRPPPERVERDRADLLVLEPREGSQALALGARSVLLERFEPPAGSRAPPLALYRIER